MSRFAFLLAAAAFVATPAMAQHAGHNMPGMTMPMPAKPAVKKRPAVKKPPKKAAAKNAATKSAAPKKAASKGASRKSAPKKAAAGKPPAKSVAGAQTPVDSHAGHAMPEMPAQPTADPHAGHDMSQMPAQPEQPADPHAGHDMSAMPGMQNQPQSADAHAGHDMSATAIDVPVGPAPPEALQGPENAADLAWGQGPMERGRAVLFGEHGNMPAYKVLIDQFETRAGKGRDGYFLDAEGWYGGDIDKLWVKTEVEGTFRRKPGQAEVQALWSHAIDPWFDVQVGVRLDARPDTRGRLVLGMQGLAPYWIEVEAAAFVSDKGDVTARFEAEHDVRITRKLILQPRAEFDFALQDIPRERVGSGLSSAELGLRLRYEFVPNFAPYIGVSYEGGFGQTRRFVRAEGDDPSRLTFLVGLRTWF